MLQRIFLPYFGAVIFALLIGAGCSKENPTISTYGSITGVVTDSISGIAISGAAVLTNPATSNVTTNTSGQFTINGVNAGTYTITTSKIHYNRKSTEVSVTASNTTNAYIALSLVTVNIEWITIPAGNFTMGSTTNDLNYNYDELPQHTVYLDDYQISKYEVTNAQYQAFMDDGGYSNSTYWTTDGWTWRTNSNTTEPDFWTSGNYNSGLAFPNYPVVGVNWYEAYAYCKWAGGSLSTEAQWEKAARGTDARYYPWGSTWDGLKCNSNDNVLPDTFTYSSQVGYFSTGQSPYGVFDMAGNIWEWVNDWYQSDYYGISPTSNPTGPTSGSTGHVLRGGSFYGTSTNCRSAARMYEYNTYLGDKIVGFRVVK
ncbi:MAG: SUMF1/EgtB/PvdO family nonheme iron enzyme [bacterium]|nr:SUMF1/EgtB/PvdO family nonheme iron enzyme [bacterium]